MAKGRKIRRNSSDQIISYTLPDDDTNGYGSVGLSGETIGFEIENFDKTISVVSTELINDVEPANISIITLNTISLPPEQEPAQELVNDFNWSGEIIQIGFAYNIGNPTYYYIENGVYHKLSNFLIINLVAEKIGKPLFFKIDNEYDYSNDPNDQYRYLDFGQLQYVIYDDIGDSSTKMYERKTLAYLNSYEEGLPVQLSDIILEGTDPVMDIKVEFEQPYTSVSPYHVRLGGDSSTVAEYRDRPDNTRRYSIIKIGEPLNYVITKIITQDFPSGGTLTTANPYILEIDVIYDDGGVENINLGSSDDSTVSGFIDGELITENVNTIKFTFTPD